MGATSNCRAAQRITVLDVLVLIAALAVGFAWVLHWWHSDAAGMAYPSESEGPRLIHVVEVVAW